MVNGCVVGNILIKTEFLQTTTTTTPELSL